MACLWASFGFISLAGGCGGEHAGPAASLDKVGDCVPEGGTTGNAGSGGGTAGMGGVGGMGGGGGPGCETDTLATCTGTTQDGWCVEQLPPSANHLDMFALWSSGPTDTWVAGAEVYEEIQYFVAHNDGCGWTRQPSPLGAQVSAIWGVGPSDVWFAGAGGKGAHFDGHAFTAFTIDPEASSINSLSGTGPNDVWAVSTSGFFHWDGAAWSRVSTGAWASGADDIWAAGPNDVWSVAGPTSIHFDGTAFTTAPIPAPHRGMNAVFANEVGIFAGGQGEQAVRFQEGAWVEIMPYGGSSFGIAQIAGVGNDIFMVGNANLWRWDGTTFVRDAGVPVVFPVQIWVSATQIWVGAAGDGLIARRAR